MSRSMISIVLAIARQKRRDSFLFCNAKREVMKLGSMKFGIQTIFLFLNRCFLLKTHTSSNQIQKPNRILPDLCQTKHRLRD